MLAGPSPYPSRCVSILDVLYSGFLTYAPQSISSVWPPVLPARSVRCVVLLNMGLWSSICHNSGDLIVCNRASFPLLSSVDLLYELDPPPSSVMPSSEVNLKILLLCGPWLTSFCSSNVGSSSISLEYSCNRWVPDYNANPCVSVSRGQGWIASRTCLKGVAYNF